MSELAVFLETDSVIYKLDAARVLLAEARTIQDAKQLWDIGHCSQGLAATKATVSLA